jgi:hypothetical protein
MRVNVRRLAEPQAAREIATHAARNKARRGEVLSVVPASYEVDVRAQAVVTSDQAVADAIRRVFAEVRRAGQRAAGVRLVKIRTR